jgi:hypothetical protein
MQIQEMEEGEGASSHDKEAKGKNISVVLLMQRHNPTYTGA